MKEKEIIVKPLFTFEVYKKVSTEEKTQEQKGEDSLFEVNVFNEKTKETYFYLLVLARNFNHASIKTRIELEKIDKFQTYVNSVWEYKDIVLDNKFNRFDDDITFSIMELTMINRRLI